MTRGELAAVRGVDARPVVVREVGDRVEVSAVGGGGCCPYYADGCLVYEVRPGVCRAYGCFRRPGEAFRADGVTRRLEESAGVRRVLLRMWDEGEAWRGACDGV